MNRIRCAARHDLAAIRMTNGLTSVFIKVLCLAASALARRDQERALAVSLAEHDQGWYGVGTVGFDVGDLPWSADTLDEDQAFLRRMVTAAQARTGWERLGYVPREEPLQSCLEQFRTLIEGATAGSIRRGWSNDRPEIVSAPWIFCPIHQVYEHEHGCVLCNAGKPTTTLQPPRPSPAN